MNLNELINQLNQYKGIATKQAVDVLLWQQAEIERLKQLIEKTDILKPL